MEKMPDVEILPASLLLLLNPAQPATGFHRTAELLYRRGNTAVIIRKEDTEKHKKPHVHVKSPDGGASFDLDGNNLTSSSIKKESLFSDWIRQNKDNLSAIWFEMVKDNPDKNFIEEKKVALIV